ncbi:hypothetical protein CA983_12890 [Streptomyces swartbergensis]|uniref:Uncharacterized protein n=1 Tax=Streptomyces swartbergensis TaxID=487165 RepID=A0A243S5L8_9ACTN|nr:hypothetical protein CA983_12890 [Streptomyces swartbergensis]
MTAGPLSPTTPRGFLSEFGALVTYGWPADSITTSSAIRFDPLKAGWEDERFAWASREAGASHYDPATARVSTAVIPAARTGWGFFRAQRPSMLRTC